MTFRCVHFSRLTLTELYQIMALRQEVFIVEQNCPYLDADGKDLACWHLMGFDGQEQIVAYTRLLPKGISYEEYPSIGRVVTSPQVRLTGVGKELMQASLDWMSRLFGNGPIKIGAQKYLERFYNTFGFRQSGEEYLEDGIPHIPMIREGKGKES